MNKIITQKDIDAVLDAFYKLNAPIQLYVGLKDLFEKLPEVKEEKNDKK